ncbi:hypothetical protein KIN20_014127 [Parelaphostrongylus tenuis]|uniref:Uncharacterized protein n=1 Tax=Parelaphostrongylus tenuis TaxID=148309 RepID=A0AAD5MYK1_PARTN|nr:hypothetical protein KIN20_014127 [Parelaphostrongylus tenuis]
MANPTETCQPYVRSIKKPCDGSVVPNRQLQSDEKLGFRKPEYNDGRKYIVKHG